MMNLKATVAIALFALLPMLAACSATVRKPRLLHPGPAGYQRNNATQFDPYPPDDMGPEIVGGRPPDFQKPPPEVIRARQQQPVGPWRSSGPLY
ncbi:MAG: membrane or secreted protein [Planctomycetes bacterium]|nr:membrane or secreted protein [Planctomycetota bacterium]